MVVTYLAKKNKASVEQSVSIVNMSRSSWYYKSKLDDSEIVSKLEEMFEKYPNRGFENYYHRIRREGIKWTWCRTLRVYQELGLVRRANQRFYLPEAKIKPLQQPEHHNEIWSMDFLSDALIDSGTFRILNLMDDQGGQLVLHPGHILYTTALMLMPAPTDASMTTSPSSTFWSSILPFSTRSKSVGIVATELLPSQWILMGMTPSGGV